ncbi:MAG: flagellar hook basal-body protein [Deltaproteobacteria bacterium]|nr:flagellar hook basal-body protein [Deltaproteobacteria bacterium]
MFIGPYPYHMSHTYLGSLAQEERMNITSNNLANANTTGFKRDVPVFEGYVLKATKTDFSQGHFEKTNNNLDMALNGPRFFHIQTPTRLRYTRNGAFTRSATREIVTQEGNPVVGGGVVPENVVDLAIDENGRITADGAEIGRLQMVEFQDVNGLAKEGNDKYVPKAPGITGTPAQATTVEQGFLERSNVEPVMESVNLIDIARTYEVFQKIVLTIQEADQKSINEVGRVV